MREDRHTSTLEGAAGYERARAIDAGEDIDYDRPTRAEAERDAELDRLEEQAR